MGQGYGYPVERPNNWDRPTTMGQMGYSQQFNTPPAPPQNQPQPVEHVSFRSSLPGRMINNIEEVKPNEVMNDGTMTIFPTLDRTCIYTKHVAPNGLIVEDRYILESVPNPNDQGAPVPVAAMEEILARLDNIERMVKKTTRHRYNGKPQDRKGDE